jgi:dethiobiotin synthetase
MMAKGFFITGTDTECGKSEVTLALMHLLQAQGHRVLGMKPVASGAEPTPDGLRNGDALRIQQQGSAAVAYDLINPYAFEPPIAPHIAARQAGESIRFQRLRDNYRVLSDQADFVLVEGVGGWKVPLGPEGDVSDLAAFLELPVILVVGMKLGCLNHALLTAEAIVANGPPLAGWVANQAGADMLEMESNLETLTESIDAPCLGFVPFQEEVSVQGVAGYLRLNGV